MPPSTYDQKKAEIVRFAEKECNAEYDRIKAIYQLKCLEVEADYKTKKEKAYRDLEQQKLEELGEIKRLYDAELEPLKVKHVEKLSAIREQYHIAASDAGLHASAISETPSSMTLVAASQQLADQQQADAGKMNPPAHNRSIDDTQESGDDTETSIPAFAPRGTTKATRTAPVKKRKMDCRIFSDDDEELDFSQSKNKDEQDDISDLPFPGSQERPSEGISKVFRGASAQRSGRNTMSSASPTETRNAIDSRNKAVSSSRKTGGQAEGGDEEEGTYSGPASQASRHNRVRPGRPEPGKYRMNAAAWPV